MISCHVEGPVRIMDIRWVLVAVVFCVAAATDALASNFYSGETQCSYQLGYNCFVVIESKNIDNIVLYQSGEEFRTDFRNKTLPNKNLFYKGSETVAKSFLSILLTAKSTGANIKIYITGGTINDANINSSFSQAILVDP